MCSRYPTFSGGELTRKGEIIQTLIEATVWRKQLRYATKIKRYDLALTAVDNILALQEKAIRAFLKNAPRRRRPRSIPKVDIHQEPPKTV